MILSNQGTCIFLREHSFVSRIEIIPDYTGPHFPAQMELGTMNLFLG